MKHLSLIFALSACCCLAAAPDQRPKFDKSSYCGRFWTHVNPWFSPSKERKDAKGGPDFAFKQYKEKAWGRAFSDGHELWGLNYSIEFVASSLAFTKKFEEMVNETYEINKDVRFSMFLSIDFSKKGDTPEKIIENDVKRISAIFNSMKKLMLEHPAFERIDGAPVVCIYMPGRHNGEGWGKVFSGVEANSFKCIWLLNTCREPAKDSNPEMVDKWVRDRIPYFDGIMQYACYTETSQAALYKSLANIMADYPQKINELSCQNTYSNHFHLGGIQTRLSQKWRKSFDTTLSYNPDSITITNFFDHWENSHTFHSYEREDFMLRYATCRCAKWLKTPFKMHSSPEIVLTNYCMVMIGQRPLDFEVIGFPLNAADKKVRVTLDICRTDGTILHSFPEKEMDLSDICVEEYSLPSEQFAAERAVVPRVRYKWNGQEFKTEYNPMTFIDTSIRDYWNFWARSTKNALICKKNSEDWSMNNVRQGGTLKYPADGNVTVKAAVESTYGGKSKRQGWSFITLKRNGSEYYTHYEDNGDMNMVRDFIIPPPAAALNWYSMELENSSGYRFTTLPIWVTSGSRDRMVKIPFACSDGSIREFDIEDVRVPFYFYPCDRDDGLLFVDRSGYMHNGRYGGTHLMHTDHNHYINGTVFPSKTQVYKTDENGRYFAHLDGSRGMLVMGGTAFPGAATYEGEFRIERLGKKMGLFGSSNRQINVIVTEDGHITASRGGKASKDSNASSVFKVTSMNTLAAGEWHHIATVYDLRKLSLYIDGELQGSVDVYPTVGAHNSLSGMTFGSLNPWLNQCSDAFIGDLRNIRAYGRNLSPKEFLIAK